MKNHNYWNEVMVKQCVSFRVLAAPDRRNVRFKSESVLFDDLDEPNCSSSRSSTDDTRLYRRVDASESRTV